MHGSHLLIVEQWFLLPWHMVWSNARGNKSECHLWGTSHLVRAVGGQFDGNTGSVQARGPGLFFILLPPAPGQEPRWLCLQLPTPDQQPHCCQWQQQWWIQGWHRNWNQEGGGMIAAHTEFWILIKKRKVILSWKVLQCYFCSLSETQSVGCQSTV